eukprot:5467648-Ditylum_brightwellii.AAC.1
MLVTKDAYEQALNSYGHKVDSYHSKNSRFGSQMVKDSCDKAHQIYSYCGVGTHHQNGIAEATKKRLSHGTRTILLHAKRK